MKMVIENVKRWWFRRKVMRVHAVIERYGLSGVKLKEVAGTLYLVKPNGIHVKLKK